MALAATGLMNEGDVLQFVDEEITLATDLLAWVLDIVSQHLPYIIPIKHP